MVDGRLQRRILTRAVCALLALCLAAVLTAAGRRPSIPRWVIWQERRIPCGAEGAECIELKNRRLRVLMGGKTVWQTEPSLHVQDALWCDIDRDGREELLLLCWKQGRYGTYRPFWVAQDETDWSQHIFIYDWTGETMRPAWMASDIGTQVERWRFDPAERLILEERSGRRSAWDWITWGLSWIGTPDTSEEACSIPRPAAKPPNVPYPQSPSSFSIRGPFHWARGWFSFVSPVGSRFCSWHSRSAPHGDPRGSQPPWPTVERDSQGKTHTEGFSLEPPFFPPFLCAETKKWGRRRHAGA